MPKVVDHDSQRRKFTDAAIRLIARDGLEGMTMRAVANQAGLSYGSLFHYFKSKDELLMLVIRHSTDLQTRRLNEYSTKHTGLKALNHLLCDDAIVDEQTRDEMAVWLAFLHKAASLESFEALNAELAEGWLDRIQSLLDAAQAAGEIRPGIDTAFEAKAIWALNSGVGQHGLLHPKLIPAGLQKKLISSYLEKLR